MFAQQFGIGKTGYPISTPLPRWCHFQCPPQLGVWCWNFRSQVCHKMTATHLSQWLRSQLVASKILVAHTWLDGNKNRGMVKSDPWVYISDPSKSPQLSEVKFLDQSQNGSEANFREDHPFLMVDTSHSLWTHHFAWFKSAFYSQFTQLWWEGSHICMTW